VLQIVEQAHRSDTGRQRAANEDSFFARAPLFAVADGMGGAQAGEVASRIAAESFEPAERGDAAPESFLKGIAEQANHRIHDLAQSDASRSGMGTTLTAAMLDGEELSLAHVGDSRAYRYRDGELKLLTSDHSLVEELRRQGRLTDEQAEDHPQRSIITRALGPEPQVEVDTMTYRVKPGDVYLLCSDGLTTMLKEDKIAAVLAAAATLEEAVAALIDEANMAGGRDNITAVAFRVDDDKAPVGRAPIKPRPDKEAATLVGASAEDAGLSGSDIRERAASSAQLGGAAAGQPQTRQPAPARRPSRRRIVLRILVPALVLGALIAGGVYGVRQVYFLGSDSAGRLALYRGLPYDLPLGIHLYSEVYAAPIQVSSLPADRQTGATDHTLRGHDDAVSLLQDLTKAARTPSPRTSQLAGGKGQGPGSRHKAGGGKQQAAGSKQHSGAGGRKGSGGGSAGSHQGGGGGTRK